MPTPAPMGAILSREIWARVGSWVHLSTLTDVQAGQHCGTGVSAGW